jgi:hypothetical protein
MAPWLMFTSLMHRQPTTYRILVCCRCCCCFCCCCCV